MPWAQVTPVLLDCMPGDLCRRRYPGHTKGCPNFGKRPSCPPHAAIWTPECFINTDIYAVWNVFPFGKHVEKMRLKHPGWSQRQAECCLYWQGTARKRLGEIIDEFMVWASGDYNPENGVAFLVPEAHGLNVTATMKSIGIELEWPPKTVAYQVAIASVGEKRA